MTTEAPPAPTETLEKLEVRLGDSNWEPDDGLFDLTSGRTRGDKWGRALNVAGPIIVVAAVLGAWQLATTTGLIKNFILPSPTSIISVIVRERSLYLSSTLTTAQEALIAFSCGSAAGVITAAIFVHSRFVQRSVFPLTIAAQSIPVVALAPLLAIWLGPGMTSKVLVAGFLCYFPTVVNMQRGLRAVDPEVMELMHSYNASWWRILVKVRLPSSLPYLFIALRLGAGGCYIGALTAEWIGSNSGLGYLITISGTEFQIPQLWGAATIASLLALMTFALVGLVERKVMPWRRGRALLDA